MRNERGRKFLLEGDGKFGSYFKIYKIFLQPQSESGLKNNKIS